jgi:hypothetical protein
MSLKTRYERYLSAPSSGAFAENASVNYIPTLTTITEPTAIVKHLAAQAKLLTKKSERVLSTVESSDGLCVDVDTTIEFVAGGGAYLPGLDDNFLADRIVNFPVVSVSRDYGPFIRITNFLAGSHCPVRRRLENPPNSDVLGPRLAS